MLVHAHPDDETLTTGGTIARYAGDGVQVTLVTCTLGEAGEIMSAGLRGLGAAAADQLGGYRIGELAAACAALGLTDQRYLGGVGRWRDSGMVVQPGGRASEPPDLHPRALVAGDRAEQVDALVEVLAEVRPQVLVSYAPDGGYGHPDHVRAHEVTMAAAARMPQIRRVFWTVAGHSAVRDGIAAVRRMPELPFRRPDRHDLPSVPDASVDTEVDVAAQVPAKIAAMRAHATQIAVWSADGTTGGADRAFALSDGTARPIFDVEQFAQARGDSTGARHDLFGGLD